VVGTWILVFIAARAIAPETPAAPTLNFQKNPLNFKELLDLLSPLTLEMWGLLALGIVMSVLSIVRLEFNTKSLLFRHAGIGKHRGRWKPLYAEFVKVWSATSVVMLLSVVIAIVVISIITTLFDFSHLPLPALGDVQMSAETFSFLLLLAMVFFIYLVISPARAYREARMFQLLWNTAGFGQVVRFRCTLSTQLFVLTRLKNLLLTLLSLGIYRPFAKISEYKMKVESITLFVKGGIEKFADELAKEQSGLAKTV
jgi:uncharacterized membrane protein YjgN (DUF898 family)